MNNETQKTLVFVGVAAVLAVLAIFWSPGSQVRTPDYAANIGEPFYPDFDNPNEATSMRVAVFESDNAQVKDFAVELKDGQWSIPSHHNYPAEGKDRLSNTAASVIGIKRQALAGRRESDFKRLGVIDPLNKKDSQIEGVGRRITLLDEANNPLCDYIIGDSIDGKPNSFYVRRPDKKQTYVAELEIDISTNFTDWIEPDLLKVESDDIAQVYLNKYSFDERSGKRVDESLLELKKVTTDEGKTSWKLDGLKDETEELQETQITDLVNELNNLKIVGVRPKPPGLSADLKLNQGIQLDLMTQVDLQTKGFFFQRFSDGSQGLSSNEGELIAVTKDGITYVLYFGEVFTGSEFDIEVGLDKPKKEDEDSKKSDEEKKEESNDSDLKKSRYVFVTVSFNEDALGKKPVEPKKPEELDETASKEKEEKKEDDKSEKKEDEKADDKEASKDKKEGEKSDKEESEDKKKDDPKFEHEKALAKYKEELQNYQTRMDTAKKTVQELNDRFADWYYVISAESFDKLNISRDKLVKEKEKPKAEEKPKTDKKADEKKSDSSEKMNADGKKESAKKEEKKSDTKSKDLPKIEPGKPGSSAKKKNADDKKKTEKSSSKTDNAPKKSDDKPKVTKEKKEAPKPAPKKDTPPKKSNDQPKADKKSKKDDTSKEKVDAKKADKK